MAAIFSQVLNMSMTGSVVILLVMLARLILKRAPKIFSYALWSVVLFRLLCPVAFTAPVSVLNALEPEVQESSESTSVIYFIPAEINQNPEFTFVPTQNQSETEHGQAGEFEHTRLDLMTVAAYIWIAGTAIMFAYSIIQYIRLRMKLVGAVAYGGNVYRADYIDTPFAMGIFSPKIYLPSDIPMNERKYIIAHERHHIRRFDHIIKLLAYLALCIHWFNPLVWAAFILAGKDMEMSCDEAVIRKMGSQIRADYSASLLRLATHKKIIAGMPLAFGEGDTKGRVMNMANWKKPKLWVSIVCGLICIAVLISCAMNPEKAAASETAVFGDCTLGEDSEELTQSEYTDYLRDAYGLTTLKNHKVYYNNGIFQVDFQFSEDAVDWQMESARKFAIDKFYTRDTAKYDLWEYDTWLIEHPSETTKQVHYRIFVDDELMKSGSYQGVNTAIVTTANNLNIREEPTTSSAVVGHYTDGSIITILEIKDGWGRTDMGWVSMNYVTTMDGSSMVDIGQMEPSVDDSTFTDIENEVKELNIREKPDISSAVVGAYPNGTIITILDTKDGWGRTDQGWVYMDYVTTVDGNTVVDTSDFQPAVDGSVIITDTELVQYGTLKMLLPSGFSAKYEDDAVVLTKDSVAVGGIQHWKYPEFQPSDIVELKKEAFGVPIGYMSSNSAYGDAEYEVFWDGNPKGLNEQHTFFTDGDTIYDVWYDENQISDGIAERFLKTVAINAEPVVAIKPGEQEAFAKCRAVVEAVQSGSYKIVSRQINAGNEGPRGYERIYCRNNEDWLSVTNVLTEGENFADGMEYTVTKSALYANGRRFSYTGTEWVEIANNENSLLPWLAEFTWDENIVAYMDTLTDENGECVMLRVDEKYIESDEYDPHYFLYFNFDPDGNFVNTQLQVNLFRDNGLSVTESIVSLDQETVNAEIQKEFQRAIG